MDWSKLLRAARLAAPDYQEQPGRPAHMVDIDRITFSAPFRRLANKTQVHPLYDNDHVHHRLIHSVEVANVGRSLGMLVGQWLVDTGESRGIDECLRPWLTHRCGGSAVQPPLHASMGRRPPASR